jgi:PAS domain S-box-containing protein
MGYLDAAGRPQGFIVDALDAAAHRAGIRIEWRIVGDLAANDAALRGGTLDLVAGTDTPERRRDFFVSEPWWSSELVLISREADSIRDESGVNGRPVAVPKQAAALIAQAYPRSRLIVVPSAATAAEAVCTGGADVAVIAAMYLRELLFAMPKACQPIPLRTFDSLVRLDYVLVGRQAAASTIGKLKDALDAITADGTLAAIAAKHPPVSTPHATRLADMLRTRYERRVLMVGSGAAIIVVLLSFVFTVKQYRARQRLRAANHQLHEDLLARERAETALRNSEARFRALFDSAPQGVVAFDRLGAIVFANRRSLEMFGGSALVGSRIESLVPERYASVFHQGASPERNPAKQPELAGVRADGTEFPIEVALGPVETDEALTLALITDIADRVALQQQLLQSQKLESVGQLAGGVAHDFNNLLTVISGYADMLLDGMEREDPARESLDEIAQAAARATGLTRQLLSFSRRDRVKLKVLSINDVLRNLEKMLRRLIGEDMELVLAMNECPLVRADAGHIEQIVVNLVVNARDAMPDGGKLTIETLPFHVDPSYGNSHVGLSAGGYAMLRVIDTGTGMTPEVQSRIFEPFFTTKEKGKGTGLGLSTVYGIVKQSGGAVLVYSEAGRGTTFKILLPAAEGSSPEDGESPKHGALTGHETILVAEDEPGVRKFVKDVLSKHGYNVLVASNGREALNLAAQHGGPIRLLLSDVIMPEIGGPELAGRIRQLYPSVAVLHMSGYTDRPLAPDADMLIEKPFTPEALLALVRDILDGGNTNGSLRLS